MGVLLFRSIWEKGVYMIIKSSHVFTTACLLAFCGAASAYTITGSVSDNDGKAIKGASVSLLKEGKTSTTDDKGKFTIHEDEKDSLEAIHPAFRN